MHVGSGNGGKAQVFKVVIFRVNGLVSQLDQVCLCEAGLVCKQAVNAAIYPDNIERYNDHLTTQGPGSIAVPVDKAAIPCEDPIEHYFASDYRLGEATRKEYSLPVVPTNVLCNEDIAALKEFLIAYIDHE